MTEKHTIRLTESELNSVISEAVKKTINEISPEFLAGAYKKSEDLKYKSNSPIERAKRERQSKNFSQAAIDKYNKLYGSEKGEDGITHQLTNIYYSPNTKSGWAKTYTSDKYGNSMSSFYNEDPDVEVETKGLPLMNAPTGPLNKAARGEKVIRNTLSNLKSEHDVTNEDKNVFLLKRVISESVKQVISELDWKTYQNARRKANEKGEYDRALKFGNAAQKEFNKAYGEDGVSGDIFLNRVSAESDDYPSHTLMRMYNYDEEGNYSNPYNYDNTKAYGIMDKYDKDGRYKRVKNPSLKRFFNNPGREKAYKNASKEMDNYVMGNYDYTQDKGWYLKNKK